MTRQLNRQQLNLLEIRLTFHLLKEKLVRSTAVATTVEVEVATVTREAVSFLNTRGLMPRLALRLWLVAIT
jgi:hypothetical protein